MQHVRVSSRRVTGAVVLALVAAISAIGYVAYGADLHLPGTDDGAEASPAAAQPGVRPATRPAMPEVAATAEPVRL